VDQQECAPSGIRKYEMPVDAQADMVTRCKAFQTAVGTWDERIKAFGRSGTWTRYDRALHHLDMAVQECSEMWDQLEGGWKHHKRQPRPADRDEALLEAIDVLTFAINAYLYTGGESDAELVAALINRSATIAVAAPRCDLGWAWDRWGQFFSEKGSRGIIALYGHGDGAHGAQWEKTTAAFVNSVRSKISDAASTLRGALASMSREQRAFDKFPAAPGFIYMEAVVPAVALCRSVPDCTIEEMYSAFCHKNDINFERQSRGY
jgi:hypothetical protein